MIACSDWPSYWPESSQNGQGGPFWLTGGQHLPWWPSSLDRGALINVEAPGCGTSVVRGPTGGS